MDRASTAYVERNNGTMRHHIGRMRRLCYAFSKKLENHRAAAALNYAWYNLGMIVKTLRVTPAMAAGVTDHVWSLEEFMDALLAEPTGEKPVKRPLAHRAPKVPARELPHGRGFLRVVQGGKAPRIGSSRFWTGDPAPRTRHPRRGLNFPRSKTLPREATAPLLVYASTDFTAAKAKLVAELRMASATLYSYASDRRVYRIYHHASSVAHL